MCRLWLLNMRSAKPLTTAETAHKTKVCNSCSLLLQAEA